MTDEQLITKLSAHRSDDNWQLRGQQWIDNHNALTHRRHPNPVRVQEWCLSQKERAHVYCCKACQRHAKFYHIHLLAHYLRQLRRRFRGKRACAADYIEANVFSGS